jgi:hypothetical protein
VSQSLPFPSGWFRYYDTLGSELCNCVVALGDLRQHALDLGIGRPSFHGANLQRLVVPVLGIIYAYNHAAKKRWAGGCSSFTTVPCSTRKMLKMGLQLSDNAIS